MAAESDTSSLRTLTESLERSLYQQKLGRRFQTLSDAYGWPCDNLAARFELLTATALERVYPNRTYWEPSAGALDVIFERSAPQVRILDLGSGMTAAWCVAMAEMYPNAEVIGVDVIPSDLSYLPPNLSIEIHDLLEGLPFPDDYFDLIHCRHGGAAAFVDHPSLAFMPEVARALKPGGVILLEDIHDMHAPFACDSPDDPTLKAAQAQHDLRVSVILAYRPPGRKRMVCGSTLAERVKQTDASRETAKVTTMELPLGHSPSDGDPENSLGALVRDSWMCAWSLNLVQLGFGDDKIEEIEKADKEAMPEEDVGLRVKFTVIWAAKTVRETVAQAPE